MLDKGYAPAEIVLDACAAGGPVRASTIRQILAVRANIAAATKVMSSQNTPSKPQPTQAAPQGQAWAWDATMQDWYLANLQA